RWMRDADAAAVTSVVEWNRAGDGDCVFAKSTMNRDLSSQSFRRSDDFVDDRQQWIGRTSCNHCRLAGCRSRLDKQIERVVVDSERCDLSAVVPGQVFPLPARAV